MYTVGTNKHGETARKRSYQHFIYVLVNEATFMLVKDGGGGSTELTVAKESMAHFSQEKVHGLFLHPNEVRIQISEAEYVDYHIVNYEHHKKP
jgi:hypothetical protein